MTAEVLAWCCQPAAALDVRIYFQFTHLAMEPTVMPTITLPTAIVARLARLSLACDSTTTAALAHICLRITGSVARFIATDGRLLAILRCEITDEAEAQQLNLDLDLLLDGDQLTAAAAAIANLKSTRLPVTLTIDVAAKEARLSTRHGAHLVRIHDGTYPSIDGLLAKYSGSAWVPSIGTYQTGLLTRAEKIARLKSSLLFSSPVSRGSRLLQAWNVAPAGLSADPADVGQATRLPAVWADHDLLILIMPITRSADAPQPALHLFQAAAPLPASMTPTEQTAA